MAIHPNLSFEQAPPWSAPMRFFLTAPWFGVVAGVLLCWAGPGALQSRWMPETLALVHLFVLGFMLQTMAGALMQFVPVAIGGNIWRPLWVANVVHPAAALGALALVFAFLTQAAAGYLIAALLLAPTGLAFALVVLVALFRTALQTPTLWSLRLALAALMITAFLGATLALGLGLGWELPYLELTDVHASWGLGGWALVLLVGVSFYVVPMFQLTPAYPAWFARVFPWAFSLVLVFATAALRAAPLVAEWVRAIALLLAAGYAMVTLRLQAQRRRRQVDATFLFFRTAMLSLLALALGGILEAMSVFADEPKVAVFLGVFAIHGVFVSAIEGMLYKIAPFMSWLHLQRLCRFGMMPPTMNQLLEESSMRRQLYAHWAALAFLAAAIFWPALAQTAGLALALECAWLGANLIQVARRYRRFRDHIRASARDR
ncbi:MAG: hypothetical protein N2441_07680 [Rhodocyclaceae bacterium]|nr:hypothetical protein [Rhodocyclaceae bacterium]